MNRIYKDTKGIHDAVYEIQNVTNEANFDLLQDNLKTTARNLEEMGIAINSIKGEMGKISQNIGSLSLDGGDSFLKGFRKKVFGDGK